MTEDSRRLGVTQSIRSKLNFLDERLWKRFSARRLELIDTLDLSSKKASEQEDEIKDVAERLRVEFGYGSEYFMEFDKLVRAAVQSVRRNRKRSSKSRRNFDPKRMKIGHEEGEDYRPKLFAEYNESVKNEPTGMSNLFISEISRLNSDTAEEAGEHNYPKNLNFSNADLSRSMITTMIQPRIGSVSISPLPPISRLTSAASLSRGDGSSARTTLLHYIEKSKSCSASTTKRNENIENLGKHVVFSSVAFVLEKSFEGANKSLTEYLRGRLNQDDWLAKFYTDLDPYNTNTHLHDAAVSLISLYTLIGCCVKDFGFDNIVLPLAECLYYSIVKNYPLISQSSIVFNADDHKSSKSTLVRLSTSLEQLNSLATIATEIHDEKGHADKKSVTIRFLSSTLEFTYSSSSSATPKLVELIENAKIAFRLLPSDSCVVCLRDVATGAQMTTDSEVESLFKTRSEIELEVFVQSSRSLRINEITSTVHCNKFNDSKIILPPPISNLHPRGESLTPLSSSSVENTNFRFLSNLEEPPQHVASYHTLPAPKTPYFPRFQPLL